MEKGPGDSVIGGSINRSGAITFRATKVGDETALAQIVALVQQAQNSKAPGQRLADKAAQYLVILAVGSGIITFVAWMVFGDVGFVLALTFAISAVVIACPDALGLATPTAVAVGTGIAARHNILIKDAATLEGVSSIQAVVLDKTGTLTEGKPSLTDVVTAPDWDDDELLRIAAGAEIGSEHPLSEAIVTGAHDRGLASPPAEQFRAIAGHGVEASVEGRAVLIGNAKLMRDRGVELADLEKRAADFASVGPDTDVRRDRRSGGRHPRRCRHDQAERSGGDQAVPRGRDRGRHDDRRQPAHGRGGRARAGNRPRLRRGPAGAEGRLRGLACKQRASGWRWSATASTTPRRWPRRMWGSPSAPGRTSPSRRRTSC